MSHEFCFLSLSLSLSLSLFFTRFHYDFDKHVSTTNPVNYLYCIVTKWWANGDSMVPVESPRRKNISATRLFFSFLSLLFFFDFIGSSYFHCTKVRCYFVSRFFFLRTVRSRIILRVQYSERARS